MKKILLGTAVALALLTGCTEEKKPATETPVAQEVKKDEVAPTTPATQEVKKDETTPVTATEEVKKDETAPVQTEEKKEETK
ncbi:hypothetical protein CKA55_05410 [Arcobacter suis]|uniref:Lipoprotein n=1 Tax=Arcobacter suis CECT 7833 TaxID=663365 RepID=A0AAD0SSC2_9BACT|nr:membrane lipoprotein lipid attachment site-containing protein [Arcobacter suis]AXX90818.1 hypothetical protein ASUIS_2400 [Arcobacter suis CECT 7833]RWS47043.1 hypothetical protein CKA55_05410 [Arcobacter suis]